MIWGIRMKKKYLIIIGIIVVILVIIACSWKALRLDRFNFGRGHVFIDWVDAMHVDETTYEKNNSNLTVSQTEINKEIGIVKFKLSGSVSNPSYKMRNWDATCLEVNTKLFSIKDDDDSVAALVNGTYYRYTK